MNSKWVYYQQSGRLECNDVFVYVGYSGAPGYTNEQEFESVKNCGPIPRGEWDISAPFDHPHKGPICMRLTPREGTETFGRDGFLIHGPHANDSNHSSSEGCIILSKVVRLTIANNNNGVLIVK